MADSGEIKKTPASTLDETMLALCLSVDSKRPKTVICHILKYGIITTEDLSELYGYDHPPRAIRDVRENGIPLLTHSIVSKKTGRRIGAYTFDDPSKMKAGRLGGRKTFSKKFKQQLITLYGSRDTITGERIHERYLQIDHRVPYEVAGDDNKKLDAADFMLLVAASNRAKSWSCEHCSNLQLKHDKSICKTCFWASPEHYTHIAEVPSRRLELVWTGTEVQAFDKIWKDAKAKGVELSTYVKQRLNK